MINYISEVIDFFQFKEIKNKNTDRIELHSGTWADSWQWGVSGGESTGAVDRPDERSAGRRPLV